MSSSAVATSALVAAAVVCWPVRGPLRWRAASAERSGSTSRRRLAPDPEPGGGLPDVLLIDLVVAALATGLPPGSAVAAARAAASAADDWPGRVVEQAPSATDGLPDAVGRAFLLAERTGASAAELLRRAAVDERSARRAAVAVAVGRLGVRLVVPLGLTVLPAFVLLGVAPVVLGLARQLLIW